MGLQHEESGSGVAGKRHKKVAGKRWWARWAPWIAMAYILAAGLFVAWAKMETIQLTYTVNQMRSERTDLQRSQQILDAELASLQSPAYLTSKAGELGLEEPPPGVVIRVE